MLLDPYLVEDGAVVNIEKNTFAMVQCDCWQFRMFGDVIPEFFRSCDMADACLHITECKVSCF